MRLDTIVVGVDFSMPSLNAARWVGLHLAPDARVILAHVVREPEAPAYSGDLFESPGEVVRRSRSRAGDRLGELSRSISPGEPEREILVGRPPEALSSLADDVGADVVVVGEHGSRPGAWGFLGSTAVRILQRSERPVILAKNPPEHPPRRILAAVDDSSHTRVVLEAARDFRERFDAAVTVNHALTPVLHSYFRMVSSPERARELEEELRSDAYDWLDARVEEAGFVREEETPAVVLDVATGHPAYEVLAAARRHEVDLIVAGSRGAGAVERTVLGSVAASILRGADCPVAVIPTGAGG